MTAATATVLAEKKGDYPKVQTYEVAASTRILKGTMVALDANDRATVPTDGDGLRVVGIAQATYDNSSGAAGDISAQVEAGVFGQQYGTAPSPGDLVYSVDNQTVSADPLSSGGAQRGVVGYVSEVRNSKAFVEMGPTRAAMAAAQGIAVQPLNIGAIRLASGAAAPAFNDGVSDGFALVDSEAFGLRMNDGVSDSFAATVSLPENLDSNQDVTLHVLGFRVGAADTDATIDIGAFFHTVGAAHTADADAGGATTAFDQATTIVSEETLTIAAADVPAGPCDLTLTIAASATLDADDLVVTSMWLEYKTK